jgi:hypothetical protein
MNVLQAVAMVLERTSAGGESALGTVFVSRDHSGIRLREWGPAMQAERRRGASAGTPVPRGGATAADR